MVPNSSGFKLGTTYLLCVGLLITLLIRSLIRRWKQRKVYLFMKSMPGPIAFPIIGTLYLTIGVTSRNLCDRLRAIINHYPGFCTYWYFEDPHLITSDREVFNAILGSYQNTDKLNLYKHFHSFVQGLFSSAGKEWRQVRKIVNPSFRSNILATFGDNFQYHTEIFLNKLGEHAIEEEFDIFQPVHLCTLDFIFDNVLSSRMDVQKQNLEFLSTYLIKGSELLFERAFEPLLWPDFIYTLIGKMKLRNDYFYPVYDYLQEMVELQLKHRNEMKKLNPEAERLQTVMEVLLTNVDAGIITKERAMADIFEMYLAGSLTTAITNAWVFKMLAMYPDFQEKAYQEVLEHFQGQEVTLEGLSKLVYVEQVIKETLRHFAPPVVGRKITKDLKVNEKLTIPAGVEVFMSIFALHHDPQYWERPEQFYPDHFSPVNETNRPKGTFAAFLSGPRACLGYKYAMQSIKFLVASTILHYKFSSDEIPPENFRDMDFRLIFMAWPATGFKVKCTRRQNATQYTRLDEPSDCLNSITTDLPPQIICS